MPARFCAYPPDNAAVMRVLEDGRNYTIGRSSDCEIRLDHRSISRQHGELKGSDGSWLLHDTGSKNGISVEGRLTGRAEFINLTWFMIGDISCSLEPLDAVAGAAAVASSESRRSMSRALSARLLPQLGIGALIPQTLDMVLQLTGLERGFVLYAPDGETLRVHATRGLRVDDLSNRHFAGSAAAVEQALTTREYVVCVDTNDSPWLAARPSVRLGGIRSLLCMPLTLSHRSIGVLYADSRLPGPPITELDIELVENVTRHAAAAIEAARLEDRIADALRSAASIGVQPPAWTDLVSDATR
ncbi:MAG: GAF domain-containing protein [Dokdonella sp.]|uniref:GAF domain-containing protein n=1 Tax=Dokdonella sp. TaxID=2291710 RepID=UPI00326567E1